MLTRMMTVAAVALALATSCDQATNATYPGPALQTLKGTMTAKQGLTVGQPVRLAIAWFAFFGSGAGPDSAPKGLVTSDVTYTGTFPQAFRFDLTGLPPAEAITEAQGTRGAVGIVIAYEDLNGDGQLTMSSGASPVVDRVLGSTADFYTRLQSGQLEDITYLYFIESQVTPGIPGLTLGYNVVTFGSGDGGFTPTVTAPATADVKIELTGAPELGLLACTDTYVGVVFPVPATRCGISTNSATTSAPLFASFVKSSTYDYVSITMSKLGADGGIETEPDFQNATVTVNGRSVEWYDPTLSFSVTDTTRSTLVSGMNVARIERAGHAPVEESCIMPGAFTVTAPTSVTVNSAVSISWVPAANERSSFSVFDTNGSLTVSNNSVMLQAPATATTLSVTIQAVGVGSRPTALCSRVETLMISVTP